MSACRYALGGQQLFKALFGRDFLLIKRHWFVYTFRRAASLTACLRGTLPCSSLTLHPCRLTQTAALALYTATLFIRPTMPRNNLSDANKCALSFCSYASCAHGALSSGEPCTQVLRDDLLQVGCRPALCCAGTQPVVLSP